MKALKHIGRGLLAVLTILWGVLYVTYEVFDDLTSTGRKRPTRNQKD